MTISPGADERHREVEIEAGRRAQTLFANVFDGGPKTRVSATIGVRDPVDLQRTTRIDPFIEDLFARNEDTIKSWVKAMP